MLITRVLPAACLLALTGAAQAQTAPADTARFYKHHLGLTASPQLDKFFTANRSLPVGLIYKRQTAPNRALRLRLVGYYSRRDSTNANPYFNPSIRSAGPDARVWEANAFVGYEWQHPLSRRVKWGYGLEAGGGYYRNYSPFTLQELASNPVDNRPFVITYIGFRESSRLTAQGRLFSAFSYSLGSRITLFAESAMLLTYSDQRQGGHYSSTASNGVVISTGGDYRDVRNRSFIYDWRPVQLLGIIASF